MPSPLTSRGLLFGAIALFASCSSGGGGSKAVAQPSGPALGEVTILSATTCPSGPGALPDTTCMHLSIDGLGIPAIEVELRVTEADVGSMPRGTVMLGTGGFGTSFYVDEPGGGALIPSLTAAGFRVVDRGWVTGWFASGPQVTPQAGRYATLATWVEENVHTVGAFCVSGNSGGAAEISYALTAWQRADIIDVAVLSSGPPMTRLDYLCEDPVSPEWMNLCSLIVPAGVMECGQPSCTPPLTANSLCPLLPPNPQPGELEADSILHPGAVLDFPNTMVHGLIGAQNCGFGVPLALLFLDAVTSQKRIEFVSGGLHLMPTTAGGRAAILQALLDATTPAPLVVPGVRTTEFDGERSVESWTDSAR